MGMDFILANASMGSLTENQKISAFDLRTATLHLFQFLSVKA